MILFIPYFMKQFFPVLFDSIGALLLQIMYIKLAINNTER